MQSTNMIKVKMTKKKVDRLFSVDKFVNFMEAIARIEDDKVLNCFNQNADCIACVSIIPSICSKERYFHLSGQKPLNPYPARHEKSYMADSPCGRLPRVNRDLLLFVYIHGS